ncbi:MAG: hypothetical protein QXX77_03385, partial [Candidatus Methanosuratincola sp.]
VRDELFKRPMRLKKVLIILTVILFPWILLPLALYYAWRRGIIGRFAKKLVLVKRPNFGGRLVEEILTLKYYKPTNGGCISVIPRMLGVQYVYGIEVRDNPERLTRNIEDVIRTTLDNVQWHGKTLISLTVRDRIEKVRVYSVSRILPGIEADVDKEAFEVSLRIADALRPKSPTVKVTLCRGNAVMEGLPLGEVV